jgi:RIO-like serine/threonine protein kinase
MPGPAPSDSDETVLRAVALQPFPFVTVSDVAPELSIQRKQTHNRLKMLVEDGLLMKRTVGTTDVFWLTPAGRQALAELD